MMGTFAQWVLGLLMILGGLGYVAGLVLRALDGDRDLGPLGGWGPFFAGLTFAALGVAVIIFH